MSTVTYGCVGFSPHGSRLLENLPIHRRIAAKIGHFWCALRHRAEIRKLMSGDPRLLEDIGISQSDVMSALSRSILTDPTEDLAARVDRRHAAWRKRADRKAHEALL